MQQELTIFPTEAALRRYQQSAALDRGWINGSGHTTFTRLKKCCIPYAKIEGRRMDAVHCLLMRQESVKKAADCFTGTGASGSLSIRALGGVLERLIAEMASLPDEAELIVEWMLKHDPADKLHQLGMLFRIWRAEIRQQKLADALDVNRAFLQLLRGNRANWPPLLRKCRKLTFRSIRWFSLFEESCVKALHKQLDIRVESSLPLTHAESAADRLGQQIRSEIMSGPWTAWTEDMNDAMAVENADVLQLKDVSRLHFSRSAGAYGEIEDMARRICWNIQTQGMEPHRIALVVPDRDCMQNIVPHVFRRFRIPCYFRCGKPVLSSPFVKAFFTWLAFPLHPERDRLVDLIRHPAIRFKDREKTVETLLKLPPCLDMERAVLPILRQFQKFESCSGIQALELLKKQVAKPEDNFNREALKAAASALKRFGSQTMPIKDMIELLEELLDSITIQPHDSHEQGVWLLNPHDAVGLDFDLVLFTGLNEGEFPGIPRQDALLGDKERDGLRRHLEKKGRSLPKMALPAADVLIEQQSVLFLTAMSMAREQLVFSFQTVDREGNEKDAGEYYRKLWQLAGWGREEKILSGPYDQWRMQQMGENNPFSAHLNKQQQEKRLERVPMPGESFMSPVPLPLCRAIDEALQSAAQKGAHNSADKPVAQPAEEVPPVKHIVSMIEMEREREQFLETPVSKRTPSNCCGHIASFRKRIAGWLDRRPEMSPSQLEVLARCRYAFLLECIFGIRAVRSPDDLPEPAQRGRLIHSILQEIYQGVAHGRIAADAPQYWAVKTSGGWIKQTQEAPGSIALATFVPQLAAQYECFAESVARQQMERVVLGHPAVWGAEREKIRRIVLNFIRHDVETCAGENRHPACFELEFSGASAVNLGTVKLRGKIDRIDLLFSETGLLEKVRVLDYKGPSRQRRTPGEYMAEIVRSLDCQLPIYAFAAQQHFFGVFNQKKVNAMTEIGRLFYTHRDHSMIRKNLKNSLISLNQNELTERFLATLQDHLQRLRAGDFSVDPLIETHFSSYQAVCRTKAVKLEEFAAS